MRQHRLDASWSACDAVMVCVDQQPHSRALIRRAWRMASALRSALIAVFVETPAWGSAPPERRNALAENLRFAEDLGAEVVRVQADDAPVG
ncbi:MAG TPA: hypothetical protein VG370_32405 [Chloroflexota bacterium]|jgi:two-component system sensor histidine kinase KdpD|nr:hypothetical protein [Chloroflexota bacterium]